MSGPRKHVFVCTNERPVGGRPSCGRRGSQELLRALAGAISADPELAVSVHVTACQCLGHCFDGPNLVVYPEGTSYRGVQLSDIEELVTEHLRSDRPVARLARPSYDDWDDDDLDDD